jgi:hypothetical protein
MEKELEFIKVSAVLHAYEFTRWRLILYSCATTAILNEYNINNITTNKVEGVSFLLKTQFRDMAVALWNKYHFLHSTLFSLSVPLARSLARACSCYYFWNENGYGVGESAGSAADEDVNFKCSEY